MSRVVPILCVVCTAGIGLTAWSQLSANGAELDIPTGRAATGTSDGSTTPEPQGHQQHPLRDALREARRKCTIPAMDEVVDELARAANPDADAATWHLYAEALLERLLQRTHLLGMRIGEPLFTELPTELARDVEAGLAAVEKAHELGDDTASLHRIQAGLMSQQITGLGSAMQWNGKIAAALEKAGERDAQDAALHTALGLRKLLAPKFFGHDPEKALEHFEFAAKAAPDDERPAVFAGMATWLQQKRTLAIEWLERAIERNPDNRFARVVLARLRRGEDEPFGRDVTETELASIASIESATDK